MKSLCSCASIHPILIELLCMLLSEETLFCLWIPSTPVLRDT